jgi:cation diffusion facilitator family transporter
VEALVLAALKVTFGLATGSRALIASSLYSIQDLMSATAAAVGMKISNRPPDQDHPYGHEKVEYLVVILMSLMLLLGIVTLVVSALASFFGEVETAEPPALMAVWFAVICAVLCWIVSGYANCAGTKLNSPALQSYGAHRHADFLSSIAVIVGVVGGKMGYPMADHIVAIIEVAHVVYTSGQMLGSAINGLMDSAAAPGLIEKMVRVVANVESVARVRRATARWAGQSLLAQVEVEVPGEMEVLEADRLREEIQKVIRKQVCLRSEASVRISPLSDDGLDEHVEVAFISSKTAESEFWMPASEVIP